jgi:hypothetical protein
MGHLRRSDRGDVGDGNDDGAGQPPCPKGQSLAPLRLSGRASRSMRLTCHTARMPQTAVPLNTTLADLDESLRALLKRELTKHGFDAAEISFEAPDKEWAASLSSPAVNVFLYDLREAKETRPIDWETLPGDGPTRERRPPLRLDASYAVTAWTRAVEDEHRLLSQVLSILYAHPVLTDDVLAGTLRNGSQRDPIRTRTATDRHEGASDFWSAVGGQYKVSINYLVTLAFESGTVLERGPEVRTRTIRLHDADFPSALIELHGAGGSVLDGSGDPVPDAWVVLVEAGRFTATDKTGRFRFDRIPPGRYHVRARGLNGAEAEAELRAPGAGADLTLRQGRRTRKR